MPAKLAGTQRNALRAKQQPKGQVPHSRRSGELSWLSGMTHTTGMDALSQAPVHLKSTSAVNNHAARIISKKGNNRSRARAPKHEHPRTPLQRNTLYTPTTNDNEYTTPR